MRELIERKLSSYQRCCIECIYVFFCCLLRLHKKSFSERVKRTSLVLVNLIFILSGFTFSIVYGFQQVWGIMAVTSCIFLISACAFCSYFAIGSYQLYLFLNASAWGVSLTVGNFTIPTGQGILNNSSLYAFIFVPGLPLVFGGSACLKLFFCMVYLLVFFCSFIYDVAVVPEGAELDTQERRMEAISRYFLLVLGQGLVVIASLIFMYANTQSKKMIKGIEKVTDSIMILDLHSNNVKKMMKKKRGCLRRMTHVEKNLQKIIKSMREYEKYLPDTLKYQYRKKMASKESESLKEDESSNPFLPLQGNSSNASDSTPDTSSEQSSYRSWSSSSGGGSSGSDSTKSDEAKKNKKRRKRMRISSPLSVNSGGGGSSNLGHLGTFRSSNSNIRQRSGVLMLVTNRKDMFRSHHNNAQFLSTMEKRTNSFVTLVQDVVERNGGTIISFSFYSCLCCFNAPMICVASEMKAASSALEILGKKSFKVTRKGKRRRREEENNSHTGVVIVKSDRVSFGHIGSDKMKKFDIFCPEMPYLQSLERLAMEKYECQIMIDEKIREAIKFSMSTRELDIFQYKHESDKRRFIMYSLKSWKIDSEGEMEWMYRIKDDLEEGEISPSREAEGWLSEGWACLMKSDFESAGNYKTMIIEKQSVQKEEGDNLQIVEKEFKFFQSRLQNSLRCVTI